MVRARTKPRKDNRSKSGAEAIAAYLRRLREETSRIRLIGLGKNLQIELPIAQAYVPIKALISRSLSGKEVGKFDKEVLQRGESVDKDVDLSEVFQKAHRYDQRGVVLLGDPGSGKTTGARQLCWRMASGQTPPEKLGLPSGILPVLLRFSRLKPEDVAKGLTGVLAQETHLEIQPLLAQPEYRIGRMR